jgi:2,3-bisphosphoglycerate-dependent phosphoglycerate mutase
MSSSLITRCRLSRKAFQAIPFCFRLSTSVIPPGDGKRETGDTIPLVFLRPAQTTWNKENLFIGWTDTPLTREGVLEARVAGKLMKENGLDNFDEAHCSVLRRATKTAWLALQELDLEWIAVKKDWRLNEQQYGALVGKNRKQCAKEFGSEQLKRWRRSWDENEKPPPTSNMKHHPGNDSRYKLMGLKPADIPMTESLGDVTRRTDAYWDEQILPKLKLGKSLLIVAHGGNIRSMIKRLDNISADQSIDLSIPRCWPLVYHLHRTTLKPMPQEGSAPGICGVFLGDHDAMEQKLEKEHKLVYDLTYRDEPSIIHLSRKHTICYDKYNNYCV